jgi:hypothetical protein
VPPELVLVKMQDGGGDTGVRAEHAGRELDHGVELLVLDEPLAQRLVRLRRAEQHAVGDDDRGAAAGLEQRRKSARKSSSVFFVLTSLRRSLDVDS